MQLFSPHIIKEFLANQVFENKLKLICINEETLTGQASFCILQLNAMSKGYVQFTCRSDSNQDITFKNWA